MADVSAPAIKEAYDLVRADKDPTNWLLLDYETERGDKLQVTATGSDGLDGFKAKLEEGKASFGYVRVVRLPFSHPCSCRR